MQYDELNHDNFMLFAAENYDSRTATTLEDFHRDLNRFNYINRCLRKYSITGKINHHLVLNHIITLFNIFNDAATPMLFFKIDKKYWNIVISFLYFVNRLPEDFTHLEIDKTILEKLETV